MTELIMTELENFLVEAIATDTPKEYVVPLNDDGAFINGHFFDDWLVGGKVSVTVLEHACENWKIEFKQGSDKDIEVTSKEVKLNEEASFSVTVNKEMIGVETDDPEGAGHIELSITALEKGHALSEVKIEVS